MSTGLLLIWQIQTVGCSYEPPAQGWGFHLAKDIFMRGMLMTFVLSFVPTWTWLHSANQCGPYIAKKTPYEYLQNMLMSSSDTVALICEYLAAPTVTWALLWM